MFCLSQRLPVQIKAPLFVVEIEMVNQPLPIEPTVSGTGCMTISPKVIKPIGVELAGHDLGQERRNFRLCDRVALDALVEKRRDLAGKLADGPVTRQSLVNLRRPIEDDLQCPGFMAIARD